MRSGGPHAEPSPPASIFRFFMRLSFPMRFRGLPTHGPPPHTASRFPHTTTRLTHFPICFPRIHHTIHKLQRIRPQIQRDRRFRPRKCPRQDTPTDSLNLRVGRRRHLLHGHGHACVGTGAHAPCLPQPYPVRFTSMVRLPLYGHIYMAQLFLHGHGHTPMARFHGHMPTACLHFDPHVPGHAFDETSADGSRGSTLQPNSLKFPAPARWAWASVYGVAPRRGVGAVGARVQAGPKAAPAAQGVDPREIWTGWTRQKSADAAPDRAGRMTDHVGQARRHACATPLGYLASIFS